MDKIDIKTTDDAALAENVTVSREVTTDFSGQLSDLRSMVYSLAESIDASQRRLAQEQAIGNLAQEVRQAARSLSGVSRPGVAENFAAAGISPKQEGGGCGCGCLSADCCVFEIVLDKVRASKPQTLLEVVDAGDIATPPTINGMEVQIYVTVDNIGVLIPGLATTMDLRVEGGLSPGPGPWVVVNRVINHVTVKKGVTKVVNYCGQVREHDEGTERVVAFKDEFGEAQGSISLNCCMSEIYPPMPLDIDLVHGGNGGGAVQLALFARRVCC